MRSVSQPDSPEMRRTPHARPRTNGPKPPQQAELLNALVEGRRLLHEKDFKGALAALEKATAIAPSDPRVLMEVGAAALGSKDLRRAREAHRAALSATSNAALEAQILFGLGRVAEEQRDRAEAQRAYAASLALRDDSETVARLTAVGGKPEAPPSPHAPCNEGFADTSAVCQCLIKKAPRLLAAAGDKPTCEAETGAPDLGDPRLALVRLANASSSEVLTFLVARDDKKLRVVAELGSELEPDGFGAYNYGSVQGGSVKAVNDRTIVVIKHEQADNDFNLGGLEQCEHHVEIDTVCVLGDKSSATLCPLSIPLDTTAGCSVAAAPEGLTHGAAALLDEVRATATKATAKVRYTIDGDGKLSVRLGSGQASLVPRGLLGEHELLPSAKPR